jgi:hypothetical protein
MGVPASVEVALTGEVVVVGASVAVVEGAIEVVVNSIVDVVGGSVMVVVDAPPSPEPQAATKRQSTGSRGFLDGLIRL